MDACCERLIALIESDLSARLSEERTYDSRLWEAMRYSVTAGGKRLRPLMLMLSGLSLGASAEELLPFASSLEMIHTYSLIHDDLPAMDNDDYRRGRLTNHKVFGEAGAILAGDGLLNLGLETMAGACDQAKEPLKARYADALAYMARCAGPHGMVAGQMADLENEGRHVSLEELTFTEFEKTSRLLMAALVGGAKIAGAQAKVQQDLEKAAGKIGIAFQIQDDVLDATGTLESLGKTPEKDAQSGKSTFVTLYGLDKAREESKKRIDEALFLLACLPGPYGECLRALTASLVDRSK